MTATLLECAWLATALDSPLKNDKDTSTPRSPSLALGRSRVQNPGMLHRRARLVVATSLGVLAIATLLFLLKPFEPRYEGRTVADWISTIDREERSLATSRVSRTSNYFEMLPPPARQVVEGFGESAVPALRKVERSGALILRLRRVLPLAANSALLKSAEQRARRRARIAQRWLEEIFGPPPPTHILTPPTHRTNNAARDEAPFV